MLDTVKGNQKNKMTTNNSIHLEPAYGQYYTEYDPQLHQPVSYPQQYNVDAIDTQKSTVRDIENTYQYHAGYDQPIQQPIHSLSMNVKSPYHINPAYDPYSLQATEYPITNYMSEPINNTNQYPTVEYPDKYLVPYRSNPKSYLWLSVFVCFINPFFGLIAVAYSVSSIKAYKNARMKRSQVHGKVALLNCIFGIGLSIAGLVIFLLVFADRL